MPEEPTELVALTLGDDEVSISLVVTGWTYPQALNPSAADWLEAEWRGESVLGSIRAKTLLDPALLDEFAEAAAKLLSGDLPGVYMQPGGGDRLIWESNDRDSRL